MKKLINDPANVVVDALRGVAAAHPELRVDLENRIVVRGDAPVQGQVGVISGGGSGHEPLHGGFVGPGMLDAAVAGEVFTSPTPDQITAATTAVAGGAGVLHVVKNYTGDVLNFQLAAELADDEGIKVETVLVDDDVAVQDSLYTAGRRGTGGTVVVEKVAGALAATGADLDRGGRDRPPGQPGQPQLRHRADPVHRAGGRHADLRARPGRDRDRHRHPRRAGPGAAPDRAGLGAGRDRHPGDPRRRHARPRRRGAGHSSTGWAARR